MEEKFDEIKSAFEQHFQEKLPKDFWADIAMDLNEEGELSKDKTALKIKESFENEHKKTAPPLFWAAIENELQEKELPKNKIKQSFEIHYNKTAPEYIWNALRQEINIDAVWTRIELVLGKSSVQENAINRLKRWMSYAALLVCMHACLPTHFYQKVVLPNKLLNLPMADVVENNGDITKKTNLATKEERNNTSKPKLNQENNNNTTSSYNKQTTAISKGNLQNKTNNENIIGLRKKERVDKIGTELTPSKGNSHTANKIGELNPDNENRVNIIPPIRDKEEQAAATETLSATLLLSASSLPTLSVDAVVEANQNLHKVTEFPDLKMGKKQPKDKDFSKLQVGVIAFVGIGDINNAETEAGHTKGTLLENKLCPSIGYGLLATFNFNENNALALEFDLQNKIKHQIHFFSRDGRHVHKVEEFDYTRLVLMYQRNVLQYELKNLKSLVSLRGGLYAGYMKNQNSFYNDVRIVALVPVFRKIDFGAKYMLGQSHSYKQITFEYGLSSNFGLYNIFNGIAAYTTIPVNHSNIFTAGAYASLRYKF